jgi:hypothetical protein
VIARLPQAAHRPLYIVVKAVHSVAFFILQSAILYLLYKAIRGESDRHAGAAALLVGGECAIYAGNGFRCPLTGLAEELGAASGSVTDIFLPQWLARNIANIYGPTFAVALLLHARNLLRPGSIPKARYELGISIGLGPTLGLKLGSKMQAATAIPSSLRPAMSDALVGVVSGKWTPQSSVMLSPTNATTRSRPAFLAS